MSGSSRSGKVYTALLLLKLYEAGLIRRARDIGAGSGTYSDLLRAHMPESEWPALEVWEACLEEHRLADKYDVVHCADARTFDLDRVRLVLISIPIVHDHIGVYLLSRRDDQTDQLRAAHVLAANPVENKTPNDPIIWS